MEGIISKKFKEKVLFDNFHLVIPEYKITWIKGNSGKGKTTLLRILAGLESIDSGEVTDFLKRRCSYVFQEPRLIEHYSALDNLLLVTKDEAKAKALLLEIGLGEDKQPVSKFSGGMKSRVAILRALLAPSDFILFDEPFNGLDSDNKTLISKIILREAENKTLIFVTHVEQDLAGLTVNNVISV